MDLCLPIHPCFFRRRGCNGHNSGYWEVLRKWWRRTFCSYLGTAQDRKLMGNSLLSLRLADSHPLPLRRPRLPPSPRFLPPPTLATDTVPCPLQTHSHQAHRIHRFHPAHRLHYSQLHRCRQTLCFALIQRHLLRHPFDPHLWRNGSLRILPLLRI